MGAQTDRPNIEKNRLAGKVYWTVVLIAAALWLSTNQTVYMTCFENGFLAFSVAGFGLMYFRLRFQLKDICCLLASMALLSLIDLKFLRYPAGALSVAAFLGFAGISAIALRSIWSAGLERRRHTLAFWFAFFSVTCNGLTGYIHNWVASLTPRILDLYLWSFDASMRVQLAFSMGQLYAMRRWFAGVGMFVYLAFPLIIAVVLAGLLLRDRAEAVSAIIAFLITGPIGVIFYGLFPALGPAYTYGNRFPWRPLTNAEFSLIHLQPVAVAGLRNAMPSLHIAWVLLAFWYSRGLSWWERGLAAAFLAITACSTLGTGEHYVIDLVVAVPFATMIYGLSAFHLPWSDLQRRMTVWLALGMTVVWIELLRFSVKIFWISPAVPWLACVATVFFAALIQNRLARHSEAAIRAAQEPDFEFPHQAHEAGLQTPVRV